VGVEVVFLCVARVDVIHVLLDHTDHKHEMQSE
jgi:hypothetical protein